MTPISAPPTPTVPAATSVAVGHVAASPTMPTAVLQGTHAALRLIRAARS